MDAATAIGGEEDHVDTSNHADDTGKERTHVAARSSDRHQAGQQPVAHHTDIGLFRS